MNPLARERRSRDPRPQPAWRPRHAVQGRPSLASAPRATPPPAAEGFRQRNSTAKRKPMSSDLYPEYV